MKSAPLASSKKSETLVPTWTENWTLLRSLWKDWNPTAEMTREVWFRSFDKSHAVKGPETVNQMALREAILAVRKTTGWKEPKFHDVADAYRHEKNRQIVAIDRATLRSSEEYERQAVAKEHEGRIDEIRTWSAERLLVAREKVERVAPTFRGKSSDLETWSHVYTGLVYVADQMLDGSEC